jgi:hypothetical protein
MDDADYLFQRGVTCIATTATGLGPALAAKYGEAIVYYQRALAVATPSSPTWVAAAFNCAVASGQLGRHDTALDYFILAAAANDGDAAFHLGWRYELARKPEVAFTYYAWANLSGCAYQRIVFDWAPTNVVTAWSVIARRRGVGRDAFDALYDLPSGCISISLTADASIRQRDDIVLEQLLREITAGRSICELSCTSLPLGSLSFLPGTHLMRLCLRDANIHDTGFVRLATIISAPDSRIYHIDILRKHGVRYFIANLVSCCWIVQGFSFFV